MSRLIYVNFRLPLSAVKAVDFTKENGPPESPAANSGARLMPLYRLIRPDYVAPDGTDVCGEVMGRGAALM